jgi:hypothetical protein
MNNKPLTCGTALIALLVGIAILLTGCLSQSKENTPHLDTVSPSTPASAPPTLESTYTATTSPTRKPTATFPPTRTPLPRQTDLPTIEPGDINVMINALHSKCRLPCWGNIIPGRTSQFAAQRLLSPLGEWRTTSVSFVYNNASTSINLTFEYGLVRSVHLYPALTKPYRINRLFTEYGKPEDVRIEVLPLTADLTTWFNLVVLYPRQGFFAVFSANGTVINSTIHTCPGNVSPDLYLFASNTYSLDQMNKILSDVRPQMEFEPLDTVADMDINQFYELFRDRSAACMATKFKFQLPP